jgi:hypothetical protein
VTTSPLDTTGRGIYEDPQDVDPGLWRELSSLETGEVCVRTAVRYDGNRGCYLIPFLCRTYGCYPALRLIKPLDHDGAQRLSFQFYLVVLTYLLRAQPVGLSGKTVTASEIRGGDFFFRGPHSLFTRPLEERFGNDAPSFLRAGSKLGGRETGFGDASIGLVPLPRVPLGYILWTVDEEFPARVVVTFDASVEEHLPLDVIWALVNVVGRLLLQSA